MLGVLDIKMSLDQVDEHIREARNQIVIFSIVMIIDHQISIKSKTEIGALAQEFNLMTKKLKSANQEIIEKMASLGQLSATVAHELNNPLEGILTYIKLQSKRLGENNLSKEDFENILYDLNFVIEETMHCGNIVKNLLLFSKQQAFEFKEVNFEHIIEKCILLVAHHLQTSDISLVRNTHKRYW